MTELHLVTSLTAVADGPAFESPAASSGDTDGSQVELVRRVAGGDQAAMAEIYRLHGGVVLAQILLVVEERAVAEEILQDTMLAVWRGASSFRAQSSVRTWVIAIARRQARDKLRRHRPQLVDDAVLSGRPSASPGPELVALERAEVTAVATAIRSLSPAHREVLGLAFGTGLSLPEVAEVLGVPLGTVKSRLAAARTALGRVMSEKGQHR